MEGKERGEAALLLRCPCPDLDLLLSFPFSRPRAAVTALLHNTLHVCLMILSLDVYRTASAVGWRSPICLKKAAVPFGLHLAFALSTLLNELQGACVGVLPLLFVVVIVSVLLVARLVARPDYTARRQVRAWDVLTQQRVEAFRRAAETRAAAAASISGARRDALSTGSSSAFARSGPTTAQQRR